ncbi:MAG: hypothetical protein ACPGXW_01095 [Synechococcus sp.]
MLTSPFQPPSQRQTILAGQLNAAHAADDQKRLLLLRSQWVHRFGVDTLPEFARVDPVDEAEPVADQPGAFERFSNVLRGSFSEVSRALDEPTMSVDDPADELQELTAPPLSTPRSLRRWLVSGDDSVPKAS